ncbi:hypothetical protein, conserved [Leishmania tarentolae]|uniref:Uncharacterized protein n=1 Tax=Leishmania tarentolae TaxID=5689 RepID=A0A640KDF9_LEITA|nr:hypothetical protein, conserved [Leishmania tarentolae]
MAAYHAATCQAYQPSGDEWARPQVAPPPPPLDGCPVSCSSCSHLFARDQVSLSYLMKGRSSIAWNVLDVTLALPRHDLTSVVATAEASHVSGGAMDDGQGAVCGRCRRQETPTCCCSPLLHIDVTELRTLFCRPSPRDKTALRYSFAAQPLLSHAPVFARCIRQRCILFDVVFHDGAGDPDMIGRGPSSRSVAGTLAVALCAHTGADVTEEEEADECNGGRSWLSLRATCSVPSTARALTWLLKVFLPLSRVPDLAIGLTLSRAAFAGSDSGVDTSIPMQWCYVERSSSCSVPYDALWAHWGEIVTPPESPRVDSTRTWTPCFAEGDRNDDFIVWGRLQHCTEKATTVLFGGNPYGSVARKYTHLCALLALLVDVRACATRHSTPNPLPAFLSDETSVLQRLLFQWFTFLGLQRTFSSACQPLAELTTEIHAIVYTRDWLAELGACDSVCPLAHWLYLVSQWLTLRVLEDALELLPSKLQWKTGTESAAETHLLFRADVGSTLRHSASLCSRSDSTVCPTREKGFFAHTRLSRWMRYRTTALVLAAAPPSPASIAAALPEMTKEEAVLVCVLENLMCVAIDPANGSRKPPCRSAAAHALILEPEAHGVMTCRLHLGSPPPNWQRDGLHVHEVVVPPLSQSFAIKPQTPSSALPTARTLHAPVVAALLSWYAVDFEAVFGHLYRVWRLAQRYSSRYPAKSCSETRESDAVASNDSNPWRGVVNTAVRCCCDGTSCSGQAHEGPPLGSLGRCLLFAIWMSLALVDIDEGVGASTPCPPLAWKGTLYYSSRRNVLHVRDWGTALHLHHVASCVSVGNNQAISGDASNTRALHDRDSRRENCSTAVKQAVSTVINSFVRARTASAAVQARARLYAQSMTHVPFSGSHDSLAQVTATSRGARDNTNDDTWRPLHICGDDSAAAEGADECVLLSWCCNTEKEENKSRDGVSGALPVQQQQGQPRMGDDDSLVSTDPLGNTSRQSSWLDYSIEEFTEASDGTIGQPPMSQASAPQVKEDQEHFALDPAVAVPLVELESHLREQLTRNAVSELYSLVALPGGLVWHTCENEEVASLQDLTRHARLRGVKREIHEWLSGSSALHEDSVQPREDEQPTSPVAAAAHVVVSLPTQRPLAGLASSKAARVQGDEESTRRTLCEAERRMRQCIQTSCTHVGALLLLQSQEARQRLHLRQMWELEQEEWQIRWCAVLVPECVLRSLLHEKAAAGAWKELPHHEGLQPRQQQPCQHLNKRLGYCSQLHQRGQRCRMASLNVSSSPPTPAAAEAHAHRVCLLCGDVEKAGRETPSRSLQRLPRALVDVSHSPPSCQGHEQEPRTPVLAPLHSPSLTMWPRRAPWQRCLNKPTAGVPTFTCAPAGAAHSAVPVLSLSLCETPPPALARSSTRRCLNELPLNHSKRYVNCARITPPYRLPSPPSSAICWPVVSEDGGTLVNGNPPRRKGSLLQHGDTRGSNAAWRRSWIKESASAAAAVTFNGVDGERTAHLVTALSEPSTAKERLARHADPRVSTAPSVLTRVSAHLASTTTVPPRRLRKPVVTWSDDVQQY